MAPHEKTCCEVQLSDPLLPSPFTEGLDDRVKQRLAHGVRFQLTGHVTTDEQAGVKAKVVLALQYPQERLASLQLGFDVLEEACEYYVDASGATELTQVSTAPDMVVDMPVLRIAYRSVQKVYSNNMSNSLCPERVQQQHE